jgi:tetratricopeptide (TPR) repeat protein
MAKSFFNTPNDQKMRIFYALLFVLIAGSSFAQNNKEQALAKGHEAIELMEKGQITESIRLLVESMKLDPENIDFPYEIGYAHYMTKDYQKTIEFLTPLTKNKDANDRVFQLLGNSYDNIGQRDKAIEIYEAGLKKIPKSGKLHLELGGMYVHTKEYDKAINYYEKGIDVEPAYPSNYYRLAKIFLNSDEEVWGMIYGEIFVNLERNSGRTAEISKLLYDTYKNEIKFTSDTSFTVSFSKNAVINFNGKKLELPFGFGVYEPTLMMEMLSEKQIDIHSLDRIRTGFVKNYFNNNKHKKYPNALFDYQNKILKEGHLESYNHWILMKGDEEGFQAWKGANNEKWDNFINWFTKNGLKIDNKNKFIRTQY